LKNKKIETLEDYLKTCPNETEIFRFETQSETEHFGYNLKENARREEGAETIFDMVLFDVIISYLTVRVCLLQPELAIN